MTNKFFISLIVALLICLGGMSVKAQMSPTASKDIYDWTPYEDVKMLNLFYDVLKQGRNYPTQAVINRCWHEYGQE